MALLSPFEKIPLQTTANLREDYRRRRQRQALVQMREEASRLNPHGIALAQSGWGISRAIEGFF